VVENEWVEPILVECIWTSRDIEVAETGQLVASVTAAIGWAMICSFNGLVTQVYPQWRFTLVRGKRPRELTFSGS
jgi:hypothetical protein